MKRSCFILSLLWCFVTVVFAQNNNYKYGTVPIEQLSMKRYEKDTTANAVVLYEYGNSSIEKNKFGHIRLIYTYKARIKIFKKEAFEKATYEIPLFKSSKSSKDKEKLVYAKAIALNQYEAPAALKEKDIYTENYSERFNLVKFTIPNVTEGSVFDVEFQTTSPFMYNFQEWRFQDNIPKVHSEYHTSIPGNYKYHVKLMGYLQLDSHTGSVKRDCLTHPLGGRSSCGQEHYVMKDIPAFTEEKYMTAEENYLSRITFELKEIEDFEGMKYKYTKSWKDVDKRLKGEDIGKQAGKENSFRKHIPKDIKAMPNTLDKAKAIYSYLQERMVWDKKYHVFINLDVKKAYEARSGNVGELNLILYSMLSAAGFDAHFMLASTRENGLPTRLFPVISEFNYLLVKLDIDNKTYLLDITGKNIPFGKLPFRALNSYGRVIDFDEGSYWYDIKAGKISLNTNYTEYRIDADGNITANMLDTNAGYLGIVKRFLITKMPAEEYLTTIEDDLSKAAEAEITDYKVDNKNNIGKPLRETFKMDFGESLTGDLVYIYPFIYDKYEENPFKLDVRTYPVDFGYSFGYNHKISVKVDPSYEITEIPKAVKYAAAQGQASLVLESYTTENEISLNLVFMVKKSFFVPDEYQELKDLFSELVHLQNNLPVVLKKKQG